MIFDYDDTLGGALLEGRVRPSGEAYERAVGWFAERMAELGFARHAALEAQLRIDQALCEAEGFGGADRFPRSFALAYEQLARGRGGALPAVREELEQLGWSVYYVMPVPLPGAKELLEQVREEYQVAVYTKGPYEVQMHKLQASGVARHADRMLIGGRKDAEEWDHVLGSLAEESAAPLEAWWSVGNSVRSDLNPAIARGLSAVHVEGYSWVFEDAETVALRAGQRLHVVRTLYEVGDLVLNPKKD